MSGSLILEKKYVYGLVAMLVMTVLFLIAFYSTDLREDMSRSETSTGSSIQVETEDASSGSSVSQVKKKPSRGTLGDLGKEAQAEFEKAEAEKAAKTDDFTKLVEKFAFSTNANENVIAFVSKESYDKIRKRTEDVYSKFSTQEKENFKKDLSDIGFESSNFDIMTNEGFEKYLDFMVKYPVKSKGRVSSIGEVSGKFDEKTGIYCGRYEYSFDGGKKLEVPSLCLDKDSKFLIHNEF